MQLTIEQSELCHPLEDPSCMTSASLSLTVQTPYQQVMFITSTKLVKQQLTKHKRRPWEKARRAEYLF